MPLFIDLMELLVLPYKIAKMKSGGMLLIGLVTVVVVMDIWSIQCLLILPPGHAVILIISCVLLAS